VINTHRIFLMEGSNTLAIRNWTNIPRIGDRILINLEPYVIKCMTWGVAEDDNITSWPDVNIAVEYAT
jgi:predicted membrane-bound spermidine synthase